jgi:hypothetical protein
VARRSSPSARSRNGLGVGTDAPRHPAMPLFPTNKAAQGHTGTNVLLWANTNKEKQTRRRWRGLGPRATTRSTYEASGL